MNKVTLLGRLTADPVLRTTTNGKSVLQVSMATDRAYGDDKTTDFHNLVVWGQTAETIAKYSRKGDQLLVEGNIRYRDYTDKAGNKKNITEIMVFNFEFGAKAKKAEQPDIFSFNSPEINEDELPF